MLKCLSIQYLQVTAVVSDHPPVLQSACRYRHACATHPQQGTQDVLCHAALIGISAVLIHQQPACKPTLQIVGLQTLRQIRKLMQPKRGVAIQQPLGRGMRSNVVLEYICRDLPGSTVGLHSGEKRAALTIEHRLYSQHALPAYHGHFQTCLRLTCRDQGNNASTWKIHVSHRLVGFPQHLGQRQRHFLCFGKQMRPIDFIHQRQQRINNNSQSKSPKHRFATGTGMAGRNRPCCIVEPAKLCRSTRS